MSRVLVLFAAVTAGLLVGAAPAGAYYPPAPVQGSVSADGATVNYQVFDPQAGVTKYGSDTYSLPVSGFQQNNGILGWISQEGASFYVNFLTYDPFRQQWMKNDPSSAGPYTQVSDFTLNNGVAAWRCHLDSGSDSVRFGTYSPRYGLWYWSGWDRAAASLLNKDGVVAWLDAEYGVIANIYDAYYEIDRPGDLWPGPWRYTNAWYPNPPTSLAIQDATVHYLEGATAYTLGYDPGKGYWVSTPTKLRAYFLAQPDRGQPPLWVWLTDMSFGGTAWTWQFGDGYGANSRSTYHNFTKVRRFPVTQSITGNPPGSDNFTQAVQVGGSLPLLPLLLQ